MNSSAGQPGHLSYPLDEAGAPTLASNHESERQKRTPSCQSSLGLPDDKAWVAVLGALTQHLSSLGGSMQQHVHTHKAGLGLVKRVLAHSDLVTLNAVATPVWIYSCATNRILWANNVAILFFKQRSLEAMQAFRFSKTSDEEHSALSLVNRVREEVEIGGSELLLSGGEGVSLPGVMPHPDNLALDVLYQQLMLSQPDADTTVCCLVQLSRVPHSQLSSRNSIDCTQRTNIKMQVGPDHADSKTSRASPLSMPAMLDLVETMLAGQPVCMGAVAALHEMLIRGEIVVQSSRISQELLVKEELELDVGLNLLQLLSNSQPAMLREPAGPEGVAGGGEGLGPTPPLTLTPSKSGKSRRGSGSQIQSQVLAAIEAADNEDDMSLSSPISSRFPEMEAVLATVDDWRFDAFKLAEATQGHPMSALGFWLIKRSGLADSLQLDLDALARFLRKVEATMPINPYHNATHAADVLQSMHVLMTKGGLLRRIGDDTQLLMLAGYIAAVIHDNEHRGLNNDFLVRVSDDLALTYNDASPMENHHVAAAFRLMRSPTYNFLRKLSRERMVRLRRLLIEMVLATDMKLHFNILSKFQAKLQVKLRSNAYQSFPHDTGSSRGGSGGTDTGGADVLPLVEDEADRGLVMQVALKVADVGHLAAPWQVHHKWVSGLEEEFFRQGDRERSAHLAVSPLMDRNKDGITKSQVGFFDIVALPLFYSWAAVFQEALPVVRAVEDNCNRWRQLEAGRTHGSK